MRVPAIGEHAPTHTEPVHVGEPRKSPAIWLLAAHGGAGASTLAASWAPAGDALGGWPAADKNPFVFIVARAHVSGLTRAHSLLLQAAAMQTGGCEALGLIIIAAHPGRPASPVRHKLKVVEAATSRSWHLPWIPEFQCALPANLPKWSPRDELPLVKRKKIDPLVDVEPRLRAVGEEIFATVREAHKARRASQ